MDPELQLFLDAHPAYCEVRDDWPLSSTVPLMARLALSAALPPIAWRSSVLGIVTRGDRVLFLRPEQPAGTIAHVLIGGRPEPGETPTATLIREIGEETGWRVRPSRLIGFRHFHHLGPPHPEMADRPYPDFVQPVYAAVAHQYDERLLLAGECPCALVDVAWAIAVTNERESLLLRTAVELAAAS